MRRKNADVPIGLLSRSEVKDLRPRSRDAYASNMVLEVLEKNPQGLTVSQIVKAAHLSRNTVLKHLERSVALRKAAKKDFGYLSIYYKGGTPETDKLASIDFGDTSYDIQILNRGIEGRYVYIQERQLDEFRMPRITGGILVRTDNLLEFIKKLHSYSSGLS